MKYARNGVLILIVVASIFTWIFAAEPDGDWQNLGPENWPVTVEAVVDDVLPRLTLYAKLMIMLTKEDRIFSLHFDLGLPIRNRYGLWRGNDKLILAACGYPCHADDASAPIVEAVWKALHNCLSCLFPHGAPARKAVDAHRAEAGPDDTVRSIVCDASQAWARSTEPWATRFST